MIASALRTAHLALGNLGVRLTPPRRFQRGARRMSRLPFGYLRSTYGPYLVNGGRDSTYLQSVSGRYGAFIPEILRAQTTPFVFLDVGANVGIFSLLAAATRGCAGVFAFEPNPDVHRTLETNARLNGAEITAFRLAISSGAPGTRMLWVPNEHSGGATFRERNMPRGQHREINVETVNRTFLDELAAEIRPPVLCKIDVEGHEAEVLDELFASKLGALIQGFVVECDERFHAEGVEGIERRLRAHGFTRVATRGRAEHFDAHWVRDR